MISEERYKIVEKPMEAVLEVSAKCNLKCSFCYNKNFKNRKELNASSWKKIIDKIYECGVSQIRFTGGEPLLHKGILNLISYAKSKNFYVIMNTNGQLINNFFTAKKIVKYVDDFLIPIHGYDFESEAKLTNYINSFDKKIKAIRFLRAAGVKIIRCCTIATKNTIDYMEKIFDIIKMLHIDDWLIIRPVPTPNNFININNYDIAILIKKMLQIQKEYSCHFGNAVPFCAYEPEKVREISFFKNYLIGGIYDDGSVRLTVASDGHIKPNYYIDVNLGDAKDDDLIECWNKDFAKKIRSFEFLPSVCKSCKFAVECRGGLTILDKKLKSRILDPLALPNNYKKTF